MLAETEKQDFLKSVSIFRNFPEDILAELVKLLVVVEFPAEYCIFERGDVGDCMFIIVEGQVRVHIGDKTFNILEKGAFFGEMAVLDSEARSASVTTLKDTLLWRLDQHELYRLMDQRSEVSRGIIEVLSKNLRLHMSNSFDDFQYIQQFAKIITAATNLEAGIFNEGSLDEVIQREDELGQLARVFQDMARRS